jgi:hypothetical protein
VTTTEVQIRRAQSAFDPQLCSVRGAVGALVLLLAFPITVAAAIVFPDSSEAVIHTALAAGTFMLGLSVFDFAAPRWLTWTACVAAIGLAAIFLAQALVGLTQTEAVRGFAYHPLVGAWGEVITSSIVMVWFMAVARTYGRGPTMVIGVLTSALVIGLNLWSITFAPASGTPQALRLLFLLPITWFLFVSSRRSPA